MLRVFVLGLVFGFLLVRSGATDYDLIERMFLLRDLHLAGVIAVAIAVAGVGMALLRRGRVRDVDGQPLVIEPKPRHAGNLWGGLVFGAGWALTGTCPGTALGQLGEGKLVALFTIAGLVAGTWLYLQVGDRVRAVLDPPGDRQGAGG